MNLTIESVTHWRIAPGELDHIREEVLDRCMEIDDEEGGEFEGIDEDDIDDNLILLNIKDYIEGVDPCDWDGLDGINMDFYTKEISFSSGEDFGDLVESIVNCL